MSRPTIRRSTFALLLLASPLIIWACGASPGPESAAAGSSGTGYEAIRPAPPFELTRLDGGSMTFDDLAKDVVILNFWASWCAPCKAEIPDLIELYEEYGDDGLGMLGVTINDLPKDSREFEAEMEMPYVSVIGTPKMVEDWSIAPWLPTTLLIKDGQIVQEWVGPRVRADFEYPIRVALGLSPPIENVVNDGTGSGR